MIDPLRVPTMQKMVTFRRMPYNLVESYNIYAVFYDNGLGSRTELIEEYQNPPYPSTVSQMMSCEYNVGATWLMPDDAYFDKDHKFSMYFDGFELSPLKYVYNPVTRMVTLNTESMVYTQSSDVKLKYFRDVIQRTYMFPEEDDYRITIEPVFRKGIAYGHHNVLV